MEMLLFNGIEFPSLIVNFSFGERRISCTSLNLAIMSFDGNYVSDEARLIDESIFYFVEEHVLRFTENEIVTKIMSEI